MDVTLQWDANTEPDLCGYEIYYKTGSPGKPYDKVYIVTLDKLRDPDHPAFTLTCLDPDEYYYFAVTAFDSEDLRSDYSSEVNSIPPIYFPYIVSGDKWETEICVINTSDTVQVMGKFTAHTSKGLPVSGVVSVNLDPHARREITIGNEFIDSGDIGYITFETNSASVVGYAKFFIDDHYRVALPAVFDSDINEGDIYISHIVSGGEKTPWYTAVSLLNTTASSQNVAFEFNNGQRKEAHFEAKEQKSFAIRDLFDGQQPQPDITSAVVTNADGIIGLELFINNVWHWIDGILLRDDANARIYYPHVALKDDWVTGIVAYNPFDDFCDITVIPYGETGSILMPVLYDTIGVREKYVGVVSDLGLPDDTAWLEIEASNPIKGLEIFARENQMAAYAAVGIGDTEGVFAKLERDGWTGIVLVNVTQYPTVVTMTAYDDNGFVIAADMICLNPLERLAQSAESFFTKGENIENATYIAYSSDREIAGLQFNTSSDGMMLDCLPGM